MAGAQRRRPVAQPRRVMADLVGLQARAPGLVVGDPVLHPVAQAPDHGLHVIAEGLRRLARRPAARLLQPLRQVPVEERGVGDDAGVEEGVHEAAVEVEALRVHGAAALGQDPRPGDGEAIGLEAELLHEGDVVAPAVIVVAGHVADGAVPDPARACGRTGPRWTRRVRPRWPLPRSGRRRWRRPRRTRRGKRSLAGLSKSIARECDPAARSFSNGSVWSALSSVNVKRRPRSMTALSEPDSAFRNSRASRPAFA